MQGRQSGGLSKKHRVLYEYSLRLLLPDRLLLAFGVERVEGIEGRGEGSVQVGLELGGHAAALIILLSS